MNEYVSLKQLAAELGVHPSNARKIALGYGVLPQRRQLPDTNRQRGLAWTREQVELIVVAREQAGFVVEKRSA